MSSSLTPTTPPTAATPPAPPPAGEADPFRYGWREVCRPGPHGEDVWDRIPLTLEDVLHPQEGDVIPENTEHSPDRAYLLDVCRARLAGVAGALVMSDTLIDWGADGPRDLSSDISVVFGVADPQRRRGKFYVAREGTRPVLAIEMVSPHTRRNDVQEKVALYYQARVPEYVLIDQERDDGPRRLVHYRAGAEGYEVVPPGADGCVPLECVGLRLGLRDNRPVCYDALTGEELGRYEDERRSHLAEREARQAAERQARDEAEARQAAERQAQDARAREEAERQAREAAEARLRELEAELRRLRGGPPA